MRKHFALKIVAGIIGLVLLSVIIAALYVSANLDRYQDRIDDMVDTMIEEATGREVQIEGDVSIKLSLIPTVAIDGVSFANAAWGTQPRMATVKSIEAKIALIPLLSGDLEIEHFILIEPDIFIETDARGLGNWVFSEDSAEQPVQPEAEATAEGLTTLGVQELEISEGRLRYRAGDSGVTTTLLIDRLSAQAEDTHSPLNLELAVAYNGHAIEAEATLGTVRALLANQAFPLKASVDTAGARITIAGQLERPIEGKGLALDITMQADSLANFSGLAGTEIPPLGPLEVSGRLSDSEAGYQLEGLKARVGKTDVSGRLAAELTGNLPRLKAQLTSTNIDLADFTAGAAPPNKDKKAVQAKRIFAADPLPLEGLRALDADITLKADSVTAREIRLQDVDLKLALDGGRLMVKPAKARVAGGTISAGIDVDARGKITVLTATVDGKQIVRGQLLKELMDSDIMGGGKTDLTVKLKGRGNSVRAIAADLNGEVLVVTGEGRIHNKAMDLAGGNPIFDLFMMLIPTMKQEPYTTLKCGVLRYDIVNGMATTDKGIAVETDKLVILGAGSINLKNEQLSLLIESRPSQDSTANELDKLVKLGHVSLAAMVQVRGTLAEPKLELNPAGLLKQGANVTAVVATLGLSTLAQDLLLEDSRDENPCLTAQRKPAPTGGGSDKPQQSKPEETKQKGGVGGLLKGITGK
jgi:uncharacterized protein involved in outer membrane biogenesis